MGVLDNLPFEENTLSGLSERVKGLPAQKAANILRLSKKFDAPVEDVAGNYEAYLGGVSDTIDWDALKKTAPKTAEFMNDPYYMAIYRDKARRLEEIEGGWKQWRQFKESSKDVLRSLLGGATGLQEGFLNSPATPEAYISTEIGGAARLQPKNFSEAPSVGAPYPQPLKRAETLRKAINSDLLKPGLPVTSDFGGKINETLLGDKTWGDLGYGMIGMIPQLAGQLVAFGLGGPAGSFAFNAGMIGGGQYLELADDATDPQRALTASIGNALAQAYLEQLSLNKMMKKLPKGSAAANRWKERAEATLTEGLTEFAQKFPEAAAELWANNPGLNTQQIAGLMVNDMDKIVKEGLFEGLVAAPFGFMGKSISMKMQEVAVKRLVAQIDQTRQQLAKSAIVDVSPEAATAHIETITDNKQIYVEPEPILVMYQTGVLSQEEIDNLLGTTKQAVEQAIETGELVQMSLAKYTVATMQNPDVAKALDQHIAENEEGVTISRATERKNQDDVRRTAEQVKKENEELKAETEALLQQVKEAAPNKATRDAANDIVKALVMRARVMSDNPAKWLRENGPKFVRGAAPVQGAMGQFAGGKPAADINGDTIETLNGKPIMANASGMITLFHRTTPEKAAQIRNNGFAKGKENTGEVFLSTKSDGQIAGYGDSVVEVMVPSNKVRVDDAFDDEVHVAVDPKHIIVSQKTNHPKMYQSQEPAEFAAIRQEITDYISQNGKTVAINTPDRIALREQIASELYGKGAAKKNKQVYFVLGLPSAGKSSVAVPLAKKTGSLIIDSDAAKEKLPEYNNGKFAGVVHEESDTIWADVVEKAARNGDNIILPLVGKDANKINERAGLFRQLGYDTHLVFVHLPVDKAVGRSIDRFKETGRFVDPEYILSVGYKPLDNYDILKSEGGWSSYEGYTNDVARGETPKLLERHLAGRGYNLRQVGRNTQQVDSRKTTESLREKLGIDRSGNNQGDSYFQSYKGSIHWKDGRAIISLFESADPSTLIHETVGHYFTESLMTEGAKEDAPDWMKKDRQTVLNYVGLESWESATPEQRVEAHEKMARSAEAYFLTGKAPSIETRSMFRRFAEWLQGIYKDLSALNVNITPEIRSVFDRMLASQDEIAQMEEVEGYHAKLPDALLSKLPPHVVDRLDKQILRARQKAEEILQGRLMDFIRADTKAAREQERKEATERISKEVAEEPFYQLLAQIEADYKANPKTTAQRYLDTALPEDQEYNFDMIAETSGYTSGMHLATDIKERNSAEKEIAARVDKYMEEWRDVFEDPEAMREEARNAMYTEDGSLLLATEQEVLNEMLTGAISAEQSRQAALQQREQWKSRARKLFESKSIEDAMKLQSFIAAERKAAEKAAKYMAEGKLDQAIEQKNVQGLAHAMVQESLNTRREFERINKYMKRQKKSDKKAWATEEHWQQAFDLMRRFGYQSKKYNGNQTESLAAYVTRMSDENPDMLAIAEWLVNDREPKPLKKLTLSELKDVEGAVKNIKQMARFGVNADGLLVINSEGVAITAGKMVDTAEKNVKNRQIDEMGRQKDPGKIAQFFAGLRKPSQWFLEMDGFKDFGVWAETMYYKLAEAQNHKSELQRKVVEAIDAAFESEGVTNEQRYIDAHKKIYVQEWGVSVTKNTMRAVLLNTGSESNLKRLLSKEPVGYKSENPWDLQTITDGLTKHLDASEFRLAQKLWDAINLYEDYTAMVKKVTGFPLQRVEPQPISFSVKGETIHLRGGYYPLSQDARDSKQAEMNAEKKLGDFIGVMPYPQSGASKARTKGAQYAIDYDLTNIYKHIADVTHDIAFRPVMHDINKIMRQDSVKEVLRRKLGDSAYQMITKWQKTVARGRQSDVEGVGFIDGLAQFARQRAVIANLLYRPSTIIQNVANFTLYGNSVEGFSNKDAYYSFMKYGVFDYIPKAASGQGKEIRDFVINKSQLMRDKMENPDYSMRELLFAADNVLTESDNETVQTAGIKLSITQDSVVKFGGKMLAFADQMTDIPMWRGAYFKAIEDGKTEREAVKFADTVIERSTGSGRVIDTSAMQRGSPAEKLMSMFMTFLNTQYNRWATEKGIAVKEKDAVRIMTFAASQYLLFGLISAMASFKGPKEDDDLAKWFAKEVLAWPLGMIPVAGSGMKYVFDSAMGFKTFGYALSPVERSIEDMLNLAQKTVKVAQGEKPAGEIAEPAMATASFLFGYPDQFNDWFWNAYDMMNGMEPRPTDLIRRRPKRER